MHNHFKEIKCSNCFTTTTPLWRRNEIGEHICNACGLYYKIHRCKRPITLKVDSFKQRTRTKKEPNGKFLGVKSWKIVSENMDVYKEKKRPHSADVLQYRGNKYEFKRDNLQKCSVDFNMIYSARKNKTYKRYSIYSYDNNNNCLIQEYKIQRNKNNISEINDQVTITFCPIHTKNGKGLLKTDTDMLKMKKTQLNNSLSNDDFSIDTIRQCLCKEKILFDTKKDKSLKNLTDELTNRGYRLESNKSNDKERTNEEASFLLKLKNLHLKNDIIDKSVNINKKIDIKSMKGAFSEEEFSEPKTLHPGIVTLEKNKSMIIKNKEFKTKDSLIVNNSLYRPDRKDEVHFLKKRFVKHYIHDDYFKYKNFNIPIPSETEDEDERMAINALLSFNKK